MMMMTTTAQRGPRQPRRTRPGLVRSFPHDTSKRPRRWRGAPALTDERAGRSAAKQPQRAVEPSDVMAAQRPLEAAPALAVAALRSRRGWRSPPRRRRRRARSCPRRRPRQTRWARSTSRPRPWPSPRPANTARVPSTSIDDGQLGNRSALRTTSHGTDTASSPVPSLCARERHEGRARTVFDHAQRGGVDGAAGARDA